MLTLNAWRSTRIAGNTAGQVILSAAGVNGTPSNEGSLGGVIPSTPGTTTLTIQVWDGAVTTGTLLATLVIPANSVPTPIPLGIQLLNGLSIVVSGGTGSEIVVLWK